MIRVSIYHWLPIADNMLTEMASRLRALPSDLISEIEMERDAVSYVTVFKFQREYRAQAVFPMPGKINQRGFCQHVLYVAPFPGLPLNALLNEIVPELKRAVSELLFAVAPDAVRSKLAILQSGIIPFQQFQSKPLDPPMDQAARLFLCDAPIVAIMLDDMQQEALLAGFNVTDVHLSVPPQNASALALSNVEGNCLLFYAADYHSDEWATHDSVIYKYCALLLYARFLDHTSSILKQTRNNIIPMRRRLALALQSHVADHLDTLAQIKRYLTYVNIKLPMVQKVIHQLEVTRAAHTFEAKIATFDEPIKVFAYPTIRSIQETTLQPPYVIAKIDVETKRLVELFEEDIEEFKTVSTELSQLLEGNLLSEQLRLSSRSLDATQALVEIQRGAKNLANANKWMTVLLMSALGMLISNSIGMGFIGTLAVGATLLTLGYLVTAFALRRHAAYFRMVIPVRAQFTPESLFTWIGTHSLLKNKMTGSHINVTWREPIRVRTLQNLYNETFITHTFEVTVDFHRRGFLNNITLEAEHLTALFEPRDLVQAIFDSLRSSACLSESAETSLYANALTLLEIPLEAKLPALNKLLTLPTTEVTNIITHDAAENEDSISKHDLFIMQDLNAQPRAYKDWLSRLLNDPGKASLLPLLGIKNVQSKLLLVERLEDAHVTHP
ncbi:MAG: hypothetical protein EYC68_00580 [Chloroflexota bacterium]|nr:MAG: hypothetical protein EYC68_00580 [Chloroflexota bacterium]